MLASAGAISLYAFPFPASAQGANDPTRFIEELGNKLVAIVNSPGSAQQKRAQMQPLIDEAVAIDEIATFVLGVYARTATPAQRQRFTQLFREVLLTTVVTSLGEFRGVTYTLTQTTTRNNEAFVGTLLTRPNQRANNVQWVVSQSSGHPKIVDVIAEGTSLRLTRRADYASFLNSNGRNLDALINALQRQVS